MLTDLDYDNVILLVRDDDLARMRAERVLPSNVLTLELAGDLTAQIGRPNLASCVSKVLEGGHLLNPQITHPRRNPTFHGASEVRALLDELTAAVALSGGSDRATAQVDALIVALTVAERDGLSVVSFVNPVSNAPTPRGTVLGHNKA